jgi:hypothetical protein
MASLTNSTVAWLVVLVLNTNIMQMHLLKKPSKLIATELDHLEPVWLRVSEAAVTALARDSWSLVANMPWEAIIRLDV